MAAYSAVVSLEKHLKQLLDSDQCPLPDQKPHLQSFYHTISTLQKSVETIFPAPKHHRQTASTLATLIRDAAYHAQDAFDSFLSAKSPNFSFPELIQTIAPIASQAQTLADSIRREKSILGAAAEADADIPPPPRSDLVSRAFRIHQGRLEKVAEEYLVDLTQRNLISVRKVSSSGRIKTCGLHDSLRDLAVKESGTEKFFHSVRRYANAKKLEEVAKTQRRVSVHKNILICLKDVYHSTKLISDARTLIYAGAHHHHPMPLFLTYDLLRVLDAYTVYFIRFPQELAHLIHLRYLSMTYNGKLASTLSKLQNLQVLIVRRQPRIIFVGKSFLPDEFWGMQHLRHLVMTETDLPKIPETPPLFANLQSLTDINAASCTREVLKRMPNLKKLSMWVEKAGVISLYLDELKQLEVFNFTVLNPSPSKKVEFESEFYLPPKLRKLSLSGCGLPWEAMGVIADLGDLEVLKLRELAFNGDEWCLLDEHVFEKLKFLMIEYLNFKTWNANHEHFPGLEQLYLRHCYDLEEIPSDIGFIGPLKLIELVDCGPAAVESAEVIKQEQEVDYEKMDFQVRIYTSYE
ncbi:hypothetical protein SASPL_118058 [Salvia splendens]|uniref:Disease resistance protein RPM1 n=1 Tax=Salvia splendens TaxID=180675 RepID=A0A8X8XYP9_SALSN|nr:hypothetical protein SASPL_118058 [Salvia splendens]